MKNTMLAAAIAALAFSGAAYAGPDGKGQGKGHKAHKHGVERVVQTRDARGKAPVHQGRHDNGLHLGHAKQRTWDRGERLPVVYLAPRYYVDDYATYRLAPPPAGMVWVRPYEDARRFYLVQAATGLITQILGR
jgi:Ni/Co efflux regulator RcnB